MGSPVSGVRDGDAKEGGMGDLEPRLSEASGASERSNEAVPWRKGIRGSELCKETGAWRKPGNACLWGGRLCSLLLFHCENRA